MKIYGTNNKTITMRKLFALCVLCVLLFNCQSCSTDDDIRKPEKEIPEGNGDNDGDGKVENQRTLTLTLKSAGSLGSYIDEKNINILENLTLTGNLNGTDIKIIRNIRNLTTLDISKANIVSGGDFYYEHYGTINNIISDWMFSGLSFKEIKLPESCIEIRWLALGGCVSLTHIEIPNKVKKIGNSAIWGCTNLISVKIPDSVVEIDITAFGLCNNLKEVILPNSITKLGNSVFQRCNSLEYVKLSENLEELENGLFNQCGSLKSINYSQFDYLQDQYKFVYDTLEEFVVCGASWFPVTELSQRLKQKSMRNPVTKVNEYQREYQVYILF